MGDREFSLSPEVSGVETEAREERDVFCLHCALVATRIGTHFPLFLGWPAPPSPQRPQTWRLNFMWKRCVVWMKIGLGYAHWFSGQPGGSLEVPRGELLCPLGSYSRASCSFKPIGTHSEVFEWKSLSHNKTDEASSTLDPAF